MEDLTKIQSPKMKQTTLEKFFSSPTNKLEGYKIESSGWLSKNESKPKTKVSTQSKSRTKISGKKSKDVGESWKQLQETFPTEHRLDGESKNSKTKGKSKNSLLLTKSESFETYGMVLPSIDKIIDNINRVKKDAKALDHYELLYGENDVTISESLINLVDKNISPTNSSEDHDALLDCKHLSKKELKKYFKSNLDYVRDIKNEVEYSTRHETYKNYAKRSRLIYNTSTIVFSQNQTDYLLQKLEKELGPECNKTEYILMVLLPEMCLRIFMDAYDMTLEEAVDYLEWRPID